MPAKFVKSYAAPDGTIFATLIGEQAYELKQLLATTTSDLPDGTIQKFSDLVLEHREEVLAILTQRERQRVRESKPKRGRPAKDKSTSTTPAVA